VIVGSEKITIDAVNIALSSFKINLSEKVTRDKYRGNQFSKIAKDRYIPARDVREIQQVIANKKTAIDSGFLFSRCLNLPA
jgi:hypothetical protein